MQSNTLLTPEYFSVSRNRDIEQVVYGLSENRAPLFFYADDR